MCDMVRKWEVGGRKANFAVAFIIPSNWESCKEKQLLRRISKVCGFFVLRFFKFTFILLRRAKRNVRRWQWNLARGC